MKLTDNWTTSIADGDNGHLLIISGRILIEEFAQSGKFNERAEVSWKYTGDERGMPDDDTARLMEEVQEALKIVMEKNKLAIMTGVYTGEGERVWVFYTRNVPAFGTSLNEALASFELLPITIYTEKDPDWEEYWSMIE